MLTVYAIPVSLYCAKLRILLRHKNLEWREIPPPGGYGSDEYKETVPSGNLPALLDGDLLIADSEAIAEYLEEKYPARPMLPQEPAARAKVRERSRFHDTRLEPELRKLFPHIGAEKAEIVQRQSEHLSQRLAQFGRMLPDSDSDRALSIGDCGYPITISWINLLTPAMNLQINWPSAVLAYQERLEEHPAVSAELADYRPKLAAWLETRLAS